MSKWRTRTHGTSRQVGKRFRASSGSLGGAKHSQTYRPKELIEQARKPALYHVTPKRLLPKIKEEGLRPQLGDIARLANQDKAAVDFWVQKRDAEWSKQALEKWREEPHVILEVDQEELLASMDLEPTLGVTHDINVVFYKGRAKQALEQRMDIDEGYLTEFHYYGNISPQLIKEQ